MRELLSNNSLFIGQVFEDKSLARRARDLIFFTTDLQTVNYNVLHNNSLLELIYFLIWYQKVSEYDQVWKSRIVS